MDREITLSSFPVRNIVNNRPSDFTTKFSTEIDLSILHTLLRSKAMNKGQYQKLVKKYFRV